MKKLLLFLLLTGCSDIESYKIHRQFLHEHCKVVDTESEMLFITSPNGFASPMPVYTNVYECDNGKKYKE